VFDRHARLPADAALVRTARDVPTTVVAADPDPARARALADAGVEVLRAPTLPAALAALRATGTRSILVEGGATLAAALVGHSLVDRLIIFQAPVILGAGALNAFGTAPPSLVRDAARHRVVERRAFADDLMTVYALRAP
jgi:diaminohydroxyphosphoribosylaminopyrimidine deaminase/5-amino-6-(5-phosphoribosylamino)uracil reductase